ncbi:hypothetical protein QFC22_001840 [Naganishia vaughanmartiniae]|uniref:Uncharacterized protein n=1 Tax=Naganishia vaughanmartiniae TaxID=1424756 RepID=A0ACC2XG93_9TREE|nr:hypothetical protein QFC22_001840 [Naganishia vaughanmartiniae]
MSTPEVFQLSLGPLTGLAFSADRTQIATCPASNDVQVYTRGGPDGWELNQTLSEHDKVITSISWAPRTNRIVTCSQDRNAYVWTLNEQTGEWKPVLVLLRINRAATCVAWSPMEDKFAVGNGARSVAVCSFDEENNWWTSKHLKKPLRSTVLSIDWHPNNVLLATGSADAKARVFSAFIKGVDSKPEPTVWGEKLPFNTVCGEFASPNGGWVHDVSFSPSGNLLAFASHDSSISIVYPSAPGQPPAAIQTIRSPSLPYTSLLFTTESALVAAGHDCQPVLFQGSQSGWSLVKSLDDPAAAGSRNMTPQATGASRFGGNSVGRLHSEAFNRFRQADTRGAAGVGAAGEGAPGAQANGGELKTIHQNTITGLQAYEWGADGAVVKFYTIGRDGRLVIWQL